MRRDDPHDYGRDEGDIKVCRFYCRRASALLYLYLFWVVADAFWWSFSR